MATRGQSKCTFCLEHLSQDSQISCSKCEQILCGVLNNKPDTADAPEGSPKLCQQCRKSLGTKPYTESVCADCETQTQCQSTKVDLDSLRQELDKLTVITISDHNLQNINKEIDDVKQQIHTLCDSYNMATDLLRKQLIDKADNIKLQNIQAFENWQTKSHQEQHSAKMLLASFDAEIANKEILSINNDTLNDIQRQCHTLLQHMNDVEAALPTLAKYTLETTGDILYHIPKSAEILTRNASIGRARSQHQPELVMQPISTPGKGPTMIPHETPTRPSFARVARGAQIRGSVPQGPRVNYKLGLIGGNVKNTPECLQSGIAQPRQVSAQAVHIQDYQQPLTASMLAAVPLQEQKQLLGERLFPVVQAMYPDLAGRITGMLLEMDNSGLLQLLNSRESLEAKVSAQAARIHGQEPLTVFLLAAVPLQEQKQLLGERLFPVVQAMYPDLAGRITGMLLEMDKYVLLQLLNSRESLKAKVEEAVDVLRAHMSKEAASTRYLFRD